MKKILIKAASLLLATTMSVCASSSASAYCLTGYSLEEPKIRYAYENWVNIKAKTAIMDGAEAWREAISCVDIGASNAVLVSVYDTNRPDVEWDALTHINPDKDNRHYIASATITFNSAQKAWNDPAALQSVAVHEFGHVLGLDDMDPYSTVIMNKGTYGPGSRYGEYKLTTPQSYDINGVNYLYG